MPVHYAGGVGDLDEIYQFASKNKLRVIEDVMHLEVNTILKRLVVLETLLVLALMELKILPLRRWMRCFK